MRTVLAIPGVDCSVRANDGSTLAHAAVLGGSVECVKLLAKVEGVPWNEKDSNGYTPLMWALRENKMDIAKVLLQCPGVDVTDVDDEDFENILNNL